MHNHSRPSSAIMVLKYVQHVVLVDDLIQEWVVVEGPAPNFFGG